MLAVPRTISRKARIFALTLLVLVCFVSLTTQARAEGGNSEHINVEVYYVPFWPSTTPEHRTTVYNTHNEWVRTTHDSRFVIRNGRIKLDRIKGEKVIGGFVSYGSVETPTFKNIRWKGNRPLPMYKFLPDAEGVMVKIPLTSAYVNAYNPQLPLPAAGKGTGVTSPPLGEMD